MATIITLIIGLLPSVLKYTGLNANLDNLITSLSGALEGLITSLVAKQLGHQAVDATILTTLQATLTALEADTSLDPTVLADISEAIAVLKGGLTAFIAAQKITDPSTLTPLPTL